MCWRDCKDIRAWLVSPKHHATGYLIKELVKPRAMLRTPEETCVIRKASKLWSFDNFEANNAPLQDTIFNLCGPTHQSPNRDNTAETEAHSLIPITQNKNITNFKTWKSINNVLQQLFNKKNTDWGMQVQIMGLLSTRKNKVLKMLQRGKELSRLRKK